MNRPTRLPLVFGLLMVFALVGCRHTKPQPVLINFNVNGTTNMNTPPDEERGNPARVRIYELNNDANFRTVTLERFWQNDEGALGTELIKAHPQVLLDPDKTENLVIEPGVGTQFIGVAADLRHPDPEAWRQIVPIGEARDKAISIRVGKDRVTITVL